MSDDAPRIDRAVRPRPGGTASAWLAFEGRLAEILAALEEDQFLVVRR